MKKPKKVGFQKIKANSFTIRKTLITDENKNQV